MVFAYMTHEETGGTQEVPNEPDVIAHFEARGWKVEEKPEPAPFVPSPFAPDATQYGEFVKLYHPAVEAFHDFPNNTEAIEGAYDSGWVIPEEEKPEESAPEDPPAGEESAPVRKSRKSKTDGPAVESKE